ncbi:SNF2 family N-terminal domain-containing protein [Apodospora peruviana]|uniref:SNF2 family N-terminal domain-containing protein n=1 Tax=Apodospora peruviana TaxID=516989 RepID=A0AAE0IT41_9PEZI|nr:SNF2 family N-terminal domain-containing protein [Apodospora peruviana]
MASTTGTSTLTPERPARPPAVVDAAFIANLEEELAIERTVLTSLEDTPDFCLEESAELILDTRRKIASLKQQLSEARRLGSKGPGPSSAAKTNTTNETDYLRLPHHFARTSTPSGMSTPGDSSSSGATSSRSAMPARKRSFSSTNMEAYPTGVPESKSRRATPSPMNTGNTTPSSLLPDFDDDPEIIDLTGDDDDWMAAIKRQKEEEERLSRNKAAADRDAAMARQLAGRASPSSSRSPYGSQPGQPNAFDRILGRPSQPSPAPSQTRQYEVKRESDPTLSTTATGSYAPVKSEAGFGSSQNRAVIKGEPSRTASQPYASSLGQAGTSQVKPEPSAPRYTMPGSFMDDDDDEFSLGNFFSSSRNSDLFNTQTSSDVKPQPSAGINFGGYSNLPSISSLPHISRAREGTAQPSAGFRQYNNFQSPFADLTSSHNPYLLLPFGHGSSQPGFAQNGSYLSRPGLPGQPPSLSDTISRVNNFDYDRMTDGNGRPLDSRLMSYIDDYVNDPRKTEEEIQNLLSNIRPDMDITEEARGETPEALKYPLYRHQQLALQWMTNMETGTNKGGILADDMGLGKTISTLALMVTRQSEGAVKTNLIIGPVALIRQWENEIQKKLKKSHSLSVFLLYGKKASYAELKKADVVLTTYGSVASEWKKYGKYVGERADSAGYRPEDDEALHKLCPLLHPKSQFYRIILDEAQCIKNKDTQTSQGVAQINAVYRWCLTGTPMMNGVTELYPLIRFLRIKPYCKLKEFTQAFKSLTPKSKVAEYRRTDDMRKLQLVLKAMMLRRMKNSKIDGKPILTLPDKTENAEMVVFSPDEASFYKDLEARSQVQFNRYLRAGTVGKNYSNILVLLLRLRQACCHPHLMDFECVGTNEVSEDQMLALARSLAAGVVERIKKIEAFECPICYDAVDDPTLLIPCGHDTCSECFASLTDNSAQDNIRSGHESGTAKCPVCRGPAEPSNVITYSTFQKAHMPEKVQSDGAGTGAPELEGSEDSDDCLSDSDSETDYEFDDTGSLGSLRDFIVGDDVDEEEDKKDVKTGAKTKIKTKKAKKVKRSRKKKAESKGKGKATTEIVKPHMLKTLRHEAGKNKEARRKYLHFLRDNWEDSAKVTEVLRLLETIQQTDEKTIIFSQWTALLDLIESQVKYKLGIKYCRYTGGMSRNQRDESVQEFVENPRTRVMLVSLRAGNAGLNLTVASRIIICDPFWNPYIEMQAIDRAHRIGQQREVQIHRILIKETVEDRIIELQERKRELVDAALDEGESKNLGRLSERELAYLFGVRSHH